MDRAGQLFGTGQLITLEYRKLGQNIMYLIGFMLLVFINSQGNKNTP